IGYEPAFTQAAFRVGDSATQVITPMNPYMIVLLGIVRKYEPSAGFGTLMARMLPFVIPFWVVWTIILTIFFVADLPLGPGNGIVMGWARGTRAGARGSAQGHRERGAVAGAATSARLRTHVPPGMRLQRGNAGRRGLNRVAAGAASARCPQLTIVVSPCCA